tara:strand:+ start:132 stop:548 length:417 start_codon:yes stop_codon:yes gene_type:complete
MEDFKELDKILRENFLETKKNADVIDRLIHYLSSLNSDDSRILNLKLNKKIFVLKVKIINAFLLRDLKLLKTLTEKYLETSSEFLSNIADDIASGQKTVSINLDGTFESGEAPYLKCCNGEKEYYETCLTLIRYLEEK